jgi:hypothetical protein
MKERPILFSGPMVRALLDGSKTQTRRIIKPQPDNDPKKHHPIKPYCTSLGQWNWVLAATGHGCGDPFDCPYGQPGDRMWVREAVAEISCRLTYRADTDDGAHCQVKRWTPSIHMPRIWSRILLEITGVRVERLQDISEADALAEGIPRDTGVGTQFCRAEPRNGYQHLWESINGDSSWDANPWVWVIEFKRVDQSSDASAERSGDHE